MVVIKMCKEQSKTVRKTKEDAASPRRPDFRGKNVAVWANENADRRWLTIKIDGMDEKFVAFENDE